MASTKKNKPGSRENDSRKKRKEQIKKQASKKVLEKNSRLPLQESMADPFEATPADILALQKSVGNQAVQRLLDSSHQSTDQVVQRDPGDGEEEEEPLFTLPFAEEYRGEEKELGEGGRQGEAAKGWEKAGKPPTFYPSEEEASRRFGAEVKGGKLMRGEEPVSTAEAGRKYGHLAAGRHIMALTGGGELRTADLLKEEKSIAKELGKKKDIHHSSLAKEAATAGEIWSASGETEYPEYQAEAAAEKGVIKGTSTASGHHRPGPARHHQLLKKIAADPEGKGRLESGQVTTELETGEGKASVPAAAMMEWGPQFEEQLKSLKGKQEGGASPEELRAMEKEGASGKFLELAKAREKMKRMIKGGAREHKKWSPADLGKARGMAPAEGVPASGLYEGYEMGEEPYDEYINPEEEEP